ncbi:MAG TPA: hypothetical protein PKZ36_01850 [Candidatus Paceibacterota bacterium]|nr:hypothetical protein [Candidatus Paceibacterota bacterium]HPT18130.1 hypothetical protein [Candidatus Paceibacterota bacterium]
MKKIILFFPIFLFSIALFAQGKALSIYELEEKNLSIAKIDEVYRNGIPDSDIKKSVFQKNYFDSVVFPKRNDFLNQIGYYLQQNGFRWGGLSNCWTKICFSTDGSVEYFIYNFFNPINAEKEKKFKELLEKFFNENKFLPGPEKFYLCGRVIWRD